MTILSQSDKSFRRAWSQNIRLFVLYLTHPFSQFENLRILDWKHVKFHSETSTVVVNVSGHLRLRHHLVQVCLLSLFLSPRLRNTMIFHRGRPKLEKLYPNLHGFGQDSPSSGHFLARVREQNLLPLLVRLCWYRA